MGDGAWCILGDFNSVGGSEERRGVNEEVSSTQREEMFWYNNFVREVQLEDLGVLGMRFSWYHPNGRSMSRIDRVLISEEWVSFWGENSLWVLPRDVSDHCPLILKNEGWEWGPKINWVSWKVVCQSKEVGGLGVRDDSVVNLSLLAKWRWRLLQKRVK